MFECRDLFPDTEQSINSFSVQTAVATNLATAAKFVERMLLRARSATSSSEDETEFWCVGVMDGVVDGEYNGEYNGEQNGEVGSFGNTVEEANVAALGVAGEAGGTDFS